MAVSGWNNQINHIIMKRSILLVTAALLLVGCGGGAPSQKEDEKGCNPLPSQLTGSESDTLHKSDSPVIIDSLAISDTSVAE